MEQGILVPTNSEEVFTLLEIIATCVDDAIAIEKHGGERIELVSALTEGGLTPSYGLIKRTQEQVSLPINVMIKPHAKSSVYTEQDLQTMLEDIQAAKLLRIWRKNTGK